MKKYVFALILFILLVTVSADWPTFNNDQHNTGRTTLTGVLDFPQTTSQSSDGLETQPVIHDIDGDNTNEIIVKDGALLKIFNLTDDVLYLEASFSVTAESNYSSPTIYPDFNGDGDDEIVVLGENTIHVIGWNSTTGAYQQIQSNTSSTRDWVTGLTCFNTANTPHACVFGSDNAHLYLYNLTNNKFINYSLADNGNRLLLTASPNKNMPLFIENWYYDGNDHIVLAGDYDGDSFQSLYVWDVNDRALETSFSGDGILDDVYSTSQSFVIHYTFDDTTDKIYTMIGWSGAHVTIVEKDGSTTDKTVSVVANTDAMGGVAIGDFVDDTDYEYCGFSETNDALFRLRCWDLVGGTEVYHNVTDDSYGLEGRTGVGGSNLYGGTVIVARTLSHLNSKHQIITPGRILSLQDDNTITMYNLSTTGSDTTSFLSAGDVNNDNNINFCGSSEDVLFCTTSDYDNSVPELWNYDLGQNFELPICVGSTITYTAEECDQTNCPWWTSSCDDYLVGVCQYRNDLLTDQERLVSDCGNGTLQYGTWDNDTLSFSCTYPRVGNYWFKIYLQDDANPFDFSVYIEKPMYVINGTTGFECNLPAGIETLQGEELADDSEALAERRVQDVLDQIHAGSGYNKNLFSLLFTLMLFGWLIVSKVRNPFIYSSSILALWILLGSLEFMDWTYVLLFGVIAIALTATTLVFSRGGD